MDMTPEYKRIYKTLPPDKKKEFREAIELEDLTTIAKYTGPIEKIREAAGRPNYNLTPAKNAQRLKTGNIFRDIEQKDVFNNEIITQAGAGELDQVANFKDLYQITIDQVKAQFFIDNEYVLNKHPSIWYNRLLMALKKELPRVTYKEPDKVRAAWEAFKNLMYEIGLFPTLEAFQNLTDLYAYTLKEGSSPEALNLIKNIKEECRRAMVDQVNTTPLTQINKIFILKSVYGYNENGAADRPEVEHTTRNINELPFFNDDKEM